MKKVVAVFLFLLVLIAGLIFNSASSSASGSEIKEKSQEVKVKAADGLELHGWLIPSSAPGNAPLVVMLPMMGHDHSSFDNFIDALNTHINTDSAGMMPQPHYLALDLRGHGKSTKLDGAELHYGEMEEADFVKIPSDVDLMIKAVLAKKNLNVDKNEIYLVGASIGANSAAAVADLAGGIGKLVLLSPGDDYRGLKPLESLLKFQGKTLILASVDDTYSAKSANTMALAKKSRCKLELYPGPDHGTTILENHPEAMKLVVDWLTR